RLFGCGGYASASVQQDASSSHYLLKGSIVTNGLEVHLLAYDTRCPRRKSAQEEKPDHNQDLVRDMDDELDIEAGFTAMSDIDADNNLTVAESASASACQATSASQTTSASQATPASQAAPYTVNWRQRSKLLDNLENALEKPEDRARLKDAIILGADPGE
ncbi:hypothetical protein BGZ70_006741, partial [Mortierella alpina]